MIFTILIYKFCKICTEPVTLPILLLVNLVLTLFFCYTKITIITEFYWKETTMGKKNITFNDIAKYTGFSKTTVSRYFNNPDSLTLKNQQIISDALDKLNYQENKVARILANGKTEFIGVIIPNLYLHY